MNASFYNSEKAHLLCQEGDYNWFIDSETEFVFLNPMPTLKESTEMQNEAVGEEYIHGYFSPQKYKSKIKRSLKRAKRFKKYLTGTKVLDIGSNVGFFVKACHDIGLDPIGIEINPNLVKKSKDYFTEGTFVHTSLESYKPKETLFNGIYCSEVLEHVVDPWAFIKRTYDLLEKDGALYLTTPSSQEYLKKGKPFRSLGAPDHKLYFNHKNIIPFLTKIGFTKIKFFDKWRRKGIKLIAYK